MYDSAHGRQRIDVVSLPKETQNYIALAALYRSVKVLFPSIDFYWVFDDKKWLIARSHVPNSISNTDLRWAFIYLQQEVASSVIYNVAHAETQKKISLKKRNQSQYRRSYNKALNSIYRKQNEFLFPLFFPLEKWNINWRTSDTVGIARTMYATKDYSLRVILKDALMDAGCEEPDVFWVLDNEYLHKGCWLLEQLQ
jgi:hypothetical protein